MRDNPTGVSLLVDAIVLRGLMVGREPSGRASKRPNYAVTWPEYLFLARLVHAVGTRSRTELLDEIDDAGGVMRAPDRWLPALLDLRRIHDLHGFTVRLVVPEPDAGTEVVSAMLAFGLDDREATNLVMAEAAAMTICGAPDSTSFAMRRAIRLRGIPFLPAAPDD